MAEAKKGDTVRVHYTGTLSDGSVFDSSEGRQPIEFQVGAGEVIPGFESAVEGMQEGEERRITIPAVDAYGARSEERMVTVERSRLPSDMEPTVGQPLEMNQAGQTFRVTIAEVTDETVVLDANHPLAGHDLTFDLRLVQIV